MASQSLALSPYQHLVQRLFSTGQLDLTMCPQVLFDREHLLTVDLQCTDRI